MIRPTDRATERLLWALAWCAAVLVDVGRVRWRIPRAILDPTRCRRYQRCQLNDGHDAQCWPPLPPTTADPTTGQTRSHVTRRSSDMTLPGTNNGAD